MRRSARRSATTVLIAVLSIALTGCGGGDDASPGAAATSGPAAANSAADVLDTAVTGQGFTVRMPDEVKPTSFDAPSRNGQTVRGQIYTYEGGSDAYSVGRIPLGKGDSYDLKTGVQGSADNMKGRIVSQAPVSFRGRPARDAQIVLTQNEQPYTVFIRYVSAEAGVFFLQYIVSGDDFTAVPAEFTAFVESFRLA